MSRVIIAGSGIAGLTCALRLAGRHEVTVVTKGSLGESNTAWAQGGIAGVVGPDDTVASHVADTLTAGAGHCIDEAVEVLCSSGADALFTLAAAGVEFDRDETGAWARGMEGAHSFARIFHAGGDATGREIASALTAATRAEAAAGRLRLLEDTMLVDISTTGEREGCPIRASGITVLRDGRLERLSADAVVLATGGAGQLFAHTTNPDAATGDGLAAALRAGAEARDLEFFQFHPTALAGPGFLISEAVRGAGALLLDEQARRFMPEIDKRAELASRDVVALALHRRSAAQHGRPCVLDARAVSEAAARFPSITAGLAAHGLDLSRDLIPVTPAAHYFMGGVSADLEGRTTIAGLFAVGEVACTGVHGANRLASNSLLEGAVFGARTADAIDTDRPNAVGSAEHRPGLPRLAGLTRPELQALTWDHLGVERTAAGLRTLLGRLGEVSPDRAGTVDREHEVVAPGAEITADPRRHTTIVERIETANLTLIAEHMAHHALARDRSLGAHTRTDAPLSSPPPEGTRPTGAATDPTPPRLLEEAAAC
ncbi:L-aspartate oxidase [Brevibacterium sp. LE-L]|uniref:L-aspartate oxidase n=1 Tax=Brevibacterium sp. LE-L TaxID=3418557 RepID=UPI003CF1CB95